MDIDFDAGQIPLETLGDRLNRSLKFADLSVQEMADHLGMNRNSLSRYLNDRGAPPRSHILRLWALRCGVPYSWLSTGVAPDLGTTGRYLQGDTPGAALPPWLGAPFRRAS